MVEKVPCPSTAGRRATSIAIGKRDLCDGGEEGTATCDGHCGSLGVSASVGVRNASRNRAYAVRDQNIIGFEPSASGLTFWSEREQRARTPVPATSTVHLDRTRVAKATSAD
eukprot:5117077-Prymnesium_polylepis.1